MGINSFFDRTVYLFFKLEVEGLFMQPNKALMLSGTKYID